MKSTKVFARLGALFVFLFLAPAISAKESGARLAAKPMVWRGEIPAQFSQEIGEITTHPTFVRHPKPRSIYLSTEFYGFLL